MKICEILDILQESRHVALVAPNEGERKLLYDRFVLSGTLPPVKTLSNHSLKLDGARLDFLIPKEAMSSKAAYFIVEFADSIPAPDLQYIGGDSVCTGEIL
jgi:hypothetical protein